jgi:citrate lyase subunit beta/citryl-CoA lyase
VPYLIAPLFVPATRPERFAKAAASAADAVIVDLEDAIVPTDKDAARGNLRAAIRLPVPAFLRINGEDTAWHAGDVAAAAELGIRHICLPKVESSEALDRLCSSLGKDISVLAQIETACGVENAAAIARHPSVNQLAFGPADFFLDMGMRASREMSLHVLRQLALASRAGDIAPPLDGPCFAIRDEAALAGECASATASGAGGKLCIHPAQTGVVRDCFRPDAEEIEWARRILGAGGDGSATIVDGRMVDIPLIARARAVLERAGEPTTSQLATEPAGPEPETHQGD